MEEQKEKKAGQAAPEGTKHSGGPLTAIWDFFSSLKLTVILLIILALVSVIGTVIDQTNPQKNMQMLVDMFGPESAPGALDWLVRLGLTNMYHSWWFVGLLMLLSSNLTVCTIERLPRVLHMVTRPQEPLTDEALRNMSLKKELRVKGDVQGFREKAKSAIRAMGYSPREADSGGALQFYGEKGKYSRLGVYITHTSVLIIFVGALIGSFWGYKGYVQIIEGGSIDHVDLINKPLLRSFGDTVPLDFRVRCDKFELKLYEGSSMPSDYLSTLTVIDGEKEVAKKTIRVNDPLQYKGIRFFQSSYGVTPEMATMTIRAMGKGAGLNVHDYNIKKGERVKLDDNLYMAMTEMAPDVAIGPDNQLVAQSDQFKGSGAAVLQFSNEAGEPVDQAVILNQAPESQPQKIPYKFAIMNYRGPYYTGLQVTYDPGVWVVWFGCTVMVLGILIAFFTYHKRVWVRLAPADKGQIAVTVAGSSNKNRHAFEGEFARLLEKLGQK